jgi:hypothetical protein
MSPVSLPSPAPNEGLEPTPSSVRCAPAFGRGSGPALVRQAKLGASGRVEVPAEQGLTNHSYRVLHLLRR